MRRRGGIVAVKRIRRWSDWLPRLENGERPAAAGRLDPDLKESVGTGKGRCREVQLHGKNAVGHLHRGTADGCPDLAAAAYSRRREQLELQIVIAIGGRATVMKPSL